MESKKLLVLDCDGVLLDWHKGFLKWISEGFGFNVNPNHPHDTWNFYDWFLPSTLTGSSLTQESLLTYIIEYNSNPRVLSPIKGAVDAIRQLRQDSEGELDIKVLTSFGSCPIQSKFREEYLNAIFDDAFSEVVVLPLGSCKEDKLKELSPDWFVEDNEDHALKAVGLGIKTFLIDTTYNQGDGGYIRVKEWSEIEDEIYCNLKGVY